MLKKLYDLDFGFCISGGRALPRPLYSGRGNYSSSRQHSFPTAALWHFPSQRSFSSKLPSSSLLVPTVRADRSGRPSIHPSVRLSVPTFRANRSSTSFGPCVLLRGCVMESSQFRRGLAANSSRVRQRFVADPSQHRHGYAADTSGNRREFVADSLRIRRGIGPNSLRIRR